jgi:hypothetical protein
MKRWYQKLLRKPLPRDAKKSRPTDRAAKRAVVTELTEGFRMRYLCCMDSTYPLRL